MSAKVAGNSIGRLSSESGVHVETIRFYERAGLMPEPPRSRGGHRLYDQRHLDRLRFIRRGRELGFTLEEIRELLRLVDGGFTCGEIRSITLAHADSVRAKIADLERLERTLRDLARRCDADETPDCPIIEALFEPEHG